MLVGTAGAPHHRAALAEHAGRHDGRWTMKGKVTLLEFSAHWCGPCKESYPGINRLRAKYESQGFRVVLATELYGYFSAERNLDAGSRDRPRPRLLRRARSERARSPSATRRRREGNDDGSYTYHTDPNDAITTRSAASRRSS